MLQFSLNGRRYTVRLNLPPQALEQVKLNVRRLVECHQFNIEPDASLRLWAENTTGRLRKRLAEAGLAPDERDTRLKPCLNKSVEAIVCDAPQRKRYQAMAAAMCRFFGESSPVAALSSVDGRRFAESLGEDGNARRRKLRYAKRLLPSVFEGMSLTLVEMPDKKQFVTGEVVERLMSVADAEFAAILALCRWCGLRCPSEVMALQWSDIEWEQGRVTVTDVKRKRVRQCPLFPCVRDALHALRRSDGNVVTHYRNERLTVVLKAFQKQCGVVPWKAPFNSLRASCESELLTRFPEHVVCHWIGHSRAVSLKHYARPLHEHWQQAIADAGSPSGAAAPAPVSVPEVLRERPAVLQAERS